MGQGNSDKSEPDLQPATPKYTDGWLDEIMPVIYVLKLKEMTEKIKLSKGVLGEE